MSIKGEVAAVEKRVVDAARGVESNAEKYLAALAADGRQELSKGEANAGLHPLAYVGAALCVLAVIVFLYLV